MLKSQLAADAAERYCVALARAGVLVTQRLVAVPGVTSKVAPAVAPEVSHALVQESVTVAVGARDLYQAAFAHVQATDLGVAPLGAALTQPATTPIAPLRSLEHLSLAPVGSVIAQTSSVPVRLLYIEYLQLEP